MKSQSMFLVAAALLLLPLMSSSAHAQVGPRIPPQYGPGFRPGLSPYLNLLRGGDISSNYYLGVRTEYQRRDDRNTILMQTRELDQRTSDLEGQAQLDALGDPEIGGTPAGFGDTRNFFNEQGTYFQRVTPATAGQGRPQPARRGR